MANNKNEDVTSNISIVPGAGFWHHTGYEEWMDPQSLN